MKEEIIDFLNKRPPVIAAYGYGSGVIKQEGYKNDDRPQIDLILVVDNLKQWHIENMELNKNDYSTSGRNYFKNKDLSTLKGNTSVTYLSNIEEHENMYKYGTIERLDLQNHLYYWDSFYMPGRFQKAVIPIKETDGIQEAIKTNRENALMIAAYLIHNKVITKKELLTTLCSLSYLGDTRMAIAENPKKVENIVNGSFEELLKIYDFNKDYIKKLDSEHLEIDLNLIQHHFINFPLSLKNYLKNGINPEDIMEYLISINKNESIEQTIKGVKTNGVVKSINYASKKLAKRFKR